MIKEWLKRNIRPLVVVDSNICHDEGGYSWNGDKGVFDVNITNESLKGFYMLELKVKNASSSMNSTFYINESASTSTQMQLPIKAKGTFKRVCHFPEKVESISWQPSQCAGSLESVDLVFKKVTKGFAKSRMLKKLKVKQYNSDMKGLLSAYDQCFAFSKNEVTPNEHQDVLEEETVFFLSANGMECLMKSSSDVSEQERSWLESKKASTFTRTNSGLIKRLDK